MKLIICFGMLLAALLGRAENIDLSSGRLMASQGNWAETAMSTAGELGPLLRLTPLENSEDATAHALRLEFPPPFSFVKGRFYRLNFEVKGKHAGVINVAIKQKAKPHLYVSSESTSSKSFTMGPQWRRCTMTFTATADWPQQDIAILWMFGKNHLGSPIELARLNCEELSAYDVINLRESANFAFADEVAKDGRGGWSDQGPANDFRDFPLGLNYYCHIPFLVINPDQNRSRAILSFASAQVCSGLNEVTLALPNRRKYLYLLHTETYGPSQSGLIIGTLTFRLPDGSTRQSEVAHRRDVGDWWSPYDLSNGALALEKTNELIRIGAYVSRFEIPSGATQVTLKTTSVSNWIVIAATAADFEMQRDPITISTIAANAEWRPIQVYPYVRPETALDFSRHAFPAPAGISGRVIAVDGNRLAFVGQPERPLRFQGFVMEPHRLFEWPVNWGKLPTDQWKRQIDAYAEAIRRAGFNLVRLHFLDQSLIRQKRNSIQPLAVKPEDVPFDALLLDLYFYLFHALKQRGIYMSADLMTSSAAYTEAYVYGKNIAPEVRPGEFREVMYYDQSRRDNWKAGAVRLLTMRNPYTGTTLAEDPAVVFLMFNNEQHFTWSPRHCQALDARWQDWMRKRSGQNRNFPQLNKETATSPGELGVAMSSFIAEIEIEMNRFYEKTVRDCGYRGLITNFNNMQTLTRVPVLSEMDLITNNPYFAHPEKVGNVALVNQNSSLTASPGLAAALRFFDRPYFITEYNHLMWNQFRHESGLRYPTLAALQDWSGITSHCQSVFPIEEKLEPFRNSADPINRAYEIICHFAFTRRDVSPNPLRIAFYVADCDLARQGQQTIDVNLSPLSWIAQVGTLYAGDRHQRQMPFTPDLSISPLNGAFRSIGKKPPVEAPGETVKSIVAKLRAEGKLSAANRSDPVRGVYQSSNGEVTLNTRDQELQVITPRLEMAAVKHHGPYKLNHLTIVSAALPAGIAAIALDEIPLNESKHLLLVIVTDALNTGMSFSSAKRLELLKLGDFPVLLRCGSFRFELNTQTMKKPKLYALNCDGSRVETLPVARLRETLQFTIDTARLKVPALFFELQETE